VSLGEIETEREDRPLDGISVGDVNARFVLDMPSDEVLRRSTASYGEIFRAKPNELHRLFSEKVVLIGDLRDPGEFHPHPDGREALHASYGHAVGIDALLSGRMVSVPTFFQTWLFTLAGAVAGLLVGYGLKGFWTKTAGLLGIAGLAAVVSLVAYRYALFLCNPFVPVVAMAIAAPLAAKVCALRLMRPC
jgi:CHASE2 domain-containing sensor protein